MLAYGWQRPQNFLERKIASLTNDTMPVEYHLRAISPDWLQAGVESGTPKKAPAVEHVQTGTQDGGPNFTLQLPLPISNGPYGREKMLPGMPVHYALPRHGTVTVMGLTGGAGYLASEFTGLLLETNRDRCLIQPVAEADLPTYDAAMSAGDRRDSSPALEVPRDLVIDAGSPEVRFFQNIPFGMYATWVLPFAFSRLEVIVGGTSLEPASQAAPLLKPLFLEDPASDSKVSDAAAGAGLVLSSVSVRVDGSVTVPILVPLFQCLPA